MRRHRTTARGVLLLLLASLCLTAGAAAAPHGKPPKRIIFPVVGKAQYTNNFGDGRGQGSHEGIDIMAARRALAVAAEAGTVKFWNTSWRAGCMIYLHGRSGTTYLYVHLNNDLTKGNDNRGTCAPGTAYAPGLKSGARVAAGEPVGYVGDSGDADGIDPHLHFEMHPGGGRAINPYPYLNRAPRLLFAAPLGSLFTLALRGSLVATFHGALELKLEQVRSWPGGLLVPQTGRSLVVLVPPTASVETSAGSAPATHVTSLPSGQGLLIWTEPAVATLAAQMGRDGELSAARIVLLD